jgi:hypothetical protein
MSRRAAAAGDRSTGKTVGPIIFGRGTDTNAYRPIPSDSNYPCIQWYDGFAG